MDWLNDLTGAPAGLFLLALAVSNVALAWVYGTLKWFVRRELQRMEQHQERQDKAIASVQKRIGQYDVLFAVSREAFDGLVKTIENHIKKENETVRKIDGIALKVTSIEGMVRNGKGRQT